MTIAINRGVQKISRKHFQCFYGACINQKEEPVCFRHTRPFQLKSCFDTDELILKELFVGLNKIALCQYSGIELSEQPPFLRESELQIGSELWINLSTISVLLLLCQFRALGRKKVVL